MQQAGIIVYTPRSETTQLTWILNRTNTENLHINYKNYYKRKQQYVERIAHIKTFVTDKTHCRSQYIGQYFGDKNLERCGVCDNCRQQHIATQPFNKRLYNDIIEKFSTQGIIIQELLKQLRPYPEKQVWEAVQLLQQEGKLMVKDGLLFKKA